MINGVTTFIGTIVVSVILLMIGFGLAAIMYSAFSTQLTGPFNLTSSLETYIPLLVVIIFAVLLVAGASIAIYYLMGAFGGAGKTRQ
jgi:hypothetical protein